MPKSVRQALGVDVGAKVAFELHEDGQIVVSRADTEHEDPAIGAFLDLLTGDIQAGPACSGASGRLGTGPARTCAAWSASGRGHRWRRCSLMQRHGWTLLFHDCLIDQLRKLHHAVQRAQRSDPTGFASNANVKLFHALSRLMLEVIPRDPSRDEYRQGSTLGPRYRHWRRARIGQTVPIVLPL